MDSHESFTFGEIKKVGFPLSFFSILHTPYTPLAWQVVFPFDHSFLHRFHTFYLLCFDCMTRSTSSLSSLSSVSTGTGMPCRGGCAGGCVGKAPPPPPRFPNLDPNTQLQQETVDTTAPPVDPAIQDDDMVALGMTGPAGMVRLSPCRRRLLTQS